MNLKWDWISPDKEFKRALELNPNSTPIHSQYAFYLMRIGRVPEALAEVNHVLELDPVSSPSSIAAGILVLLCPPI